MDTSDWWTVENAGDVVSPGLLVYVDRVEENIRQMVTLAGGAERLRPHVKTHKMAEMIRLQQAAGIQKFKCATIAEAEMVAGCGAKHGLLAYQPVGPNVARFVALVKAYPKTTLAAVVDTEFSARAMSAAASAAGVTVELLVDLDCGMGRTGIAPGPAAAELYRKLSSLPGVVPGGLHAYDGHVHQQAFAERQAVGNAAMSPVHALRAQLVAAGLPVPRLIVGGTPSFPVHAPTPEVECSPGTCVFSDASYQTRFPDLPFWPAAVLLTRVISKPGTNRLCLDLGHKAVASEMPHPRVKLLGIPDAAAVVHSEEHLVIETAKAADYTVGDVVYGIPWHICPTVALHASVAVVRGGRWVETWRVAARDRMISI